MFNKSTGSSPVISSQCESACGDTGDSNGHRPVTPVDNEVTVNCQTSQATICLDDSHRWSLADYKKRKATNMEKHLNALSDNRQSSTKMTYTPEGTTTAIMNSTSESSNASSDSESPSSDTVITTESSGSIQITSRVRKQGSKKRLSGINGEFSLGKLIDNKIERELSQEGSSCAGSSECGSQGTNEDVSEDDTKKDGDEPSAAESLAQELKELENKLRSSRDFEVRQKLRTDIREIRALIKELGSGVQPPTYAHSSTTVPTQPEQYVSVVPSNSDTVVPSNCKTVVIEHHVPHDVVRHHRHVSPRASFLSDRDVVIATSSDSDKEEAATDEQNMTSCEQGDTVTSSPPRIITPLTNQTVTTGQSTTLECMVVNGDDASIRWFQDAEQLDPSEQFEHIFDGSVAKLVIAAIQPEHTGMYRCLVKTTGGDTETSASIVVEAPRCAPEFTEPLTDVTSQVGDDQVVLQCRLCGMPLPRVTWYHNATLVRNRAESNQSFDSGVAQLTLSPVSHDLAGDYQCVARNMSGESRTVCQLTVEEAPNTAPEEISPEFTSPLTDTHVDDGDTVTLECHVTGQPTPDVTWHKDDKLLPNCSDSCQSYVNGVTKLVLEDIVASGAGVYLCTAKNQAGEATSEANVSVRVQAPKPAPAQPTKQPVFLRPLEDVKITEGDTLILECSVAAHPTPSVDWFRNREPFEATPECSLSFDGTTAKLQIDAVSSKFAGMYKCLVKNSLGSQTELEGRHIQPLGQRAQEVMSQQEEMG
ncbi:hypothetical protein NP493_1020g01047 [Ridgeia piscesae]|uniref:Ig-like domain-containing protein n=1 Tax=Ridgeia piscesae TaxID=27915 RepID=A0AAD9KI78_RIDPI|nr:hypothetical protein NP493_1020g01047 [Ridgeia piscesae]